MKNWMFAVMVTSAYSLKAQAEPVLFSDNVLMLGDAIVIEGKETRYYDNVRLSPTANGEFKVLDAVEKSLATVTETSVSIIETLPVQVFVKATGYTPTPCFELETAVTRKDTNFYAVVAMNPLQTLVACAQVLQPYTLDIPLDVKNLPSGDYSVIVNGMSVGFHLD